MTSREKALEHKAEGNKHFQSKNFEEAIKHFSLAIECDGTDAVFFSNRSACYASLGNYEEALKDGNKAVELKPEWAKAYSRQGLALFQLGRVAEAIASYKKGLELDASNSTLQSGLQDALKVEAQQKQIYEMGLAMKQMWFSMDWWAILQQNPQFAEQTKDSKFRDKLDQISKDPSKLNEFASDPNVAAAVSYLVQTYQVLVAQQKQKKQQEEMQDKARRERLEREAKEKKEREAKEAAEKEAAMTDEQRQALAEKDRGTKHYKAKEFDQAIEAYSKSFELNPEDVSALTNRAAVYIEKGDYDKAVADAELAIETARAQRAGFTLVARAYERIGSARMKQGRLEEALAAFNSSLGENRTAGVLKKKNACEKAIEIAAKKAYQDPVKAEEAKQKGNEFFGKQQYPEAIKQYEEASKRNPNEPTYHTNRAKALGKLMEYPSAVKACDDALKIDDKNFKAWLLKGHYQYHMKDYKNTLDSYRKAEHLQPDSDEVKQSIERTLLAIEQRNRSVRQGGADDEETQAAQARARSDPEIQAILADPVMRKVLQDMSTDPKAAAEHMKNATIRDKIEKLIAAGIVGTR